MVLTKSDLIAELQNEVRVLVHLMSKITPPMLDYRPTPKQRSTIELLRYLSMMGPTLVQVALGSAFSAEQWKAAADEAAARNFDQLVAAIAAQSDTYAQLLGNIPESAFREELTGFSGKTTRGLFIVDLVLKAHAAYRMQLFLYLKACGREELTTMNLWQGADPPAAAV